MYRLPNMALWTGRTDDGETEHSRWHQVMQPLDLSATPASPGEALTAYALLGFCCDEGVRRNAGRIGAHAGPAAIREHLRNLPFPADPRSVRLFDAGDVTCDEDDLEGAQQALSDRVFALLGKGYRPLLMGGGHEIAFGHFAGIHQHTASTAQNIGIINLDAHFDLRPYRDKGTSGTPFRQAHDLLMTSGKPFHYLVLGIQEVANTAALFNTARELGVRWETCTPGEKEVLRDAFTAVDRFAAAVEGIYLTIDLDVLNQAFAPGVSAPSPLGLDPHTVLRLLRHIHGTGKVVSADIAELNPAADINGQTARLAATLLATLVTLGDVHRR